MFEMTSYLESSGLNNPFSKVAAFLAYSLNHKYNPIIDIRDNEKNVVFLDLLFFVCDFTTSEAVVREISRYVCVWLSLMA